MGRARLPVVFIEREKCRKATFNKRTQGLKKKCFEFSTLCGVDTAMIIYGPDSENTEAEIWPEDPTEVQRIIERYQAKIAEQRPKSYDVIAFFKDRQNKVEAEIVKVQKRICEVLYPTWHDSLNHLDKDSLTRFIDALDAKIEACNQRITMLKQIGNLKGKAPAAESAATRSHLLFTLNVPQRQLNLAAPMDPLSDNNHNNLLPYYPSPQIDEGSASSSSYLFNVEQNLLPRMNEMVDHWSGFPPSYYNGMQFHNNNYYPTAALPNIPSQNIKYEAASFQNRPLQPMQGLQPNSFYAMLQAETLNSVNMSKYARGFKHS